VTVSEVIEVQGHIIDAGTLTRLLDDVLELGTDYTIERFDVGKNPDDPSYARIRVVAADDDLLQHLLSRLQSYGANLVDVGEALLREVETDGVFPDDFYSTTNLATQIRLNGRWLAVPQPEMDCGLVVAPDGLSVRTVPVSDVRRGDRLVLSLIHISEPTRPY
jgi:hypothetical protein